MIQTKVMKIRQSRACATVTEVWRKGAYIRSYDANMDGIER